MIKLKNIILKIFLSLNYIQTKKGKNFPYILNYIYHVSLTEGMK